MTKTIKNRVEGWLSGLTSASEKQTKRVKTRNNTQEEAWQVAINAKLAEGNIRVAVRIFGGPIQPLVEAITKFVNLLLRGGCPKDIRPILFGGNLIALNKESEGLRPIAIGYVWRRLTAKCANKHTITKLSAYFAPLQLGIRIPGGCGRHETLRERHVSRPGAGKA